jgi:PhnB protein
MRVAVFVKASKASESGEMPSEKLLADMGRYNEELLKAGIMTDAAGLHPTSKAVRVRFSGSKRTVINGPFPETKELVAGYWIWNVKSMDEAIAWLKKCPNPMPEDSDIEIRPHFEAEDFGKEFTPELREKEAAMEAELSMRKANVQAYLFFNGQCEQALDFYTTALHAKVGGVMRYSESPDPLPPEMNKPEFANRIMHSEFKVGSITVMASDDCSTRTVKHEGIKLALSVPTEADATRVFKNLSEKGTIDMPLTPTFWSPNFGMVTDPFGIGWMVMVQPARGQ